MQEYNDALQRADRLSVARENFLMGKKNTPNLVTQEDLTIYTNWLVCHLHSLKIIHRYVQVCETVIWRCTAFPGWSGHCFLHTCHLIWGCQFLYSICLTNDRKVMGHQLFCLRSLKVFFFWNLAVMKSLHLAFPKMSLLHYFVFTL